MENQGPRKATDVLLDVEGKLDTLLSIIRTQDLNMKLLSNKLNSLIEKLDKQPDLKGIAQRNAVPQFTVETPVAATPPPHFMQPATPGEVKQIPINSEYQLPVEDAPVGFRRTSRPETYAGDNTYLQKLPEPQIKLPTQTIKPPPGRSAEPSELIVPVQTTKQASQLPPPPMPDKNVRREPLNQGAVPVEQRVVDKNGKSVFLADVEIIDHNTSMPIFKTRTNGAGKWAAPLPVGNYRVNINKRESLTKQKIEVVQDIQVTGAESPLVLNMMIIK